MTDKPSVAELERLVAEGRSAQALQVALAILQAIDDRAGRLDGVVAGAAQQTMHDETAIVAFAARFAAAFGRLWTERDLPITLGTYERLLGYHHWLDLMFSVSEFRSSDKFIARVAENAGNGTLNFDEFNFLRLLVLRCKDSALNVDFDQFWRANRFAAAVAFLSYLGARCVFSPRALELRERLLEWLPNRIAEVKLGALTLARLPEVYMHCSYAFTAGKHAIKRPLMEQMRRLLLEAGVAEVAAMAPPQRAERPTIIVIGEQFVPGHAVFRSHSRAVQSLRPRFNLIGLVYPNAGETSVGGLFDACIAIPSGDFLSVVRELASEICARRPALILYLGVGMAPIATALAALRLAPIQGASFGHAATTMSAAIDYFILPEDFVGSRECFSEKIVALPRTAMPFASRPRVTVARQRTEGPLRVAIPASTMKLNPTLFHAIAEIGAGAKAPVAFHFLPLGATGLAYAALSRAVRSTIPHAVVHPQLPHERYMERLGQCDFFLCPFPYGNMNSIIDAFLLGLPGVCLDGAEPHAHADAAMFARIGLPGELAATSISDYVAAAIRLIDDQAWRAHCSHIVRTADLDDAFFGGDAGQFCAAIENLLRPSS